ncbi:aldehyde reductase [Sporothrix brasiliensis 5110]|uniref:Aldehyde reductase n=1 Tax=Sporothrix brasiliensis 5110 TaxID=1398154 RepID=A0A0C2ETI4_9PEZI|nr:aldehyde reductase [Sporothrix brasiliensis 5110]KIH89814.1 aldehyde reductase [Sporothrix brasiliensis 5110]
MAPLSIRSTIKLNSGYELPLLGFGLYRTPPAETEDVVLKAFAAGYRHIDSAAAYRNEAGAGAAVRNSGIPRSELFFTTKVPYKKISYEGAKKQVADSLALSGLDYIDLVLLHAPYGGSEARKGAWRALVEAVEAGHVRSIGVSNYGVHHLEELLVHIKELEEERGGPGKGGILSVGQWEIHPWVARRDIVDWSAKHNVAVQAYSPLVRGDRWGEAALTSLADKYKVSEAQVLIRWSLQKGHVPLPKSANPSRIKSNADVYGFELTADEVAALETTEYEPVCWDPTVAPLDE